MNTHLFVLIWMTILIAIIHINNFSKVETIIYWIAQVVCTWMVFIEAGSTNKDEYKHRKVAFIFFLGYMAWSIINSILGFRFNS